MEHIKRPDTLPPPPRISPSNRKIGENAYLEAEKGPKPETAQAYLQELVLGERDQGGLLERVTQAKTLEQLQLLANETRNILYQAQALVALGHPDAAVGNTLFKTTLSRYREREQAITEAIGNTSPLPNLFTVTERSSCVMDVLNRFLAVYSDTESLTKTAHPLTIEQFKSLCKQGKELKDELGLLPNRVLVARVLAYASQDQIADSFSETDVEALAPELNDPGMPVMVPWAYAERLPDCDDATFTKLEQTYTLLSEQGHAVCASYVQGADRQSPAWYKAFEQFENAWLAFYVDRLGKVVI